MRIRACSHCGRDMLPSGRPVEDASPQECAACGHVAVPQMFGDFGTWEAFAQKRQRRLTQEEQRSDEAASYRRR